LLMQSYLTPEEIAQGLKVEVAEIESLIEQGKLKAVRIGSSIRVPESELERLSVTCAVVPAPKDNSGPLSTTEVPPDGSRWCFTRTGRAKFRISGSVADGADIWPGRMQYPIKFPKQFMEAVLSHFRATEVAVGGKFDDPGRGSLGEFIQQKLKIKMNPAVYLAALLIEEGYAEPTRRGYIRFRSKSERAGRAN
jgi:excisionase family DNA binding protein